METKILDRNDFNKPWDGTFYHKDTNVFFWYWKGAMSEWAAERGATHTLEVRDILKTDGRGYRALKVLKTVVYVGVDEDANGDIVWEKWLVKRHEQY